MLTRVLIVVTALLSAVVVVQYNRMSRMSSEFVQAQRQAAADTRRAIIDSLGRQGNEIQQTLGWLHEYYKARDGLQRPNGLWIDGHPDFEGISVWIFDVYQGRRLNGDTEEQARAAVAEAIRQSGEWHAKHP